MSKIATKPPSALESTPRTLNCLGNSSPDLKVLINAFSGSTKLILIKIVFSSKPSWDLHKSAALFISSDVI